ncbi:MAG: glutamate-5-semialdehyde dehydrogenase [Chthoniobacterales bacterium]
MSDLKEQIHTIGAQARKASRELARLSRQEKDVALIAMADELEANPRKILVANALDLEKAEKSGLSSAMMDRLRLNEERLKTMAKGIRDVVGLTDPVGESLREWTRPNGLKITKVRTPIGVVGIIYESRPNVTADAAVLCIKTGNATILRGGSESIHSNLAIAEVLQQGGAKAGLPENSVQLIPVTDREAVKIMAQMDEFIDVIVPRGGHALIEAVVANARMPVIKHFHGVCIIYVDKEADFAMAEQIIINAKCQRPGVCNAMETLLVHEKIAAEFLGKIAPALATNKVELRGDEATRKILGESVKAATEQDWTTEYLDLILAVRVVSDLDSAVQHINHYGSHHSDAIITRDAQVAENFLHEVDSATVYWNASTRFTDGAEFGFGAEIGISTDKLHARGPMALEELTTYKYLIRGEGQIR